MMRCILHVDVRIVCGVSRGCVVHGHGHTNIDSIIDKLDLPKKINSDNYNYAYKTFVNVNLIKAIIISIFLVIVLVIIYKKKNV